MTTKEVVRYLVVMFCVVVLAITAYQIAALYEPMTPEKVAKRAALECVRTLPAVMVAINSTAYAQAVESCAHLKEIK